MAQYLEYGLQGKTAIVTGAGTGIGAACALELAKGGAKVALFGRRTQPLEETRQACLAYTQDVLAVGCDVSDGAAVQAAVAQVKASLGPAALLVNNAGVESRLKPGQTFFGDLFDTLTPEEYLKFFRIHSLGHYQMNLAVIPDMQKNRFGRIVNITSVTAVDGSYSTPAYTASKAAAICQTKAFAAKYGPDNITVNSISPGMVDTPMKIDATPEEFAFVSNITPLKRVAQPIDIARIALFLLQEQLFVTGQNLIADGGCHM